MLDTAWHHVVATYDNATAKIYVDGTLRASTTSTVRMAANTLPLMIGRGSDGTRQYGGVLDEIAIYGTVLPAGRIQAHYAAATTFDTTAPSITLSTPADGSQTNDTTPLFAGTAGTQPGDSSTVTVLVYDGTSATGTPAQTLTTTRAADGSYAVEPGAPLSEGTHTAQAEQRDTALNVGRSAARTFTVTTADITPPAVTLTTPPDGSSGTDATPTFSGAAGTAPGDLPTVTVNVYAGLSPAGEPIQTLTTLAVAASWSIGGDSLPEGYLYRAGRAVGQRRESRPHLSARLHDRDELQGRHPGGRPGGVLAPGRVERNDSSATTRAPTTGRTRMA